MARRLLVAGLLATALLGCNGPRTNASPVARTGELASTAAPSQGILDAARADPSDVSAPLSADAASEARLDTAPDAAPLVISEKDPWLVRCRKRAAELKCVKPARCRELCTQMRGARFCKPQVDAFMACLMKTPREAWICDGESQPALRDEACVPERGAVTDCLHTSDGQL